MDRNKSNILIAIATYREAENIVKLIEDIRSQGLKNKILIINDYSNDNTEELIKKLNNNNDLIYLQRPKKLGLGTAHKLSILYAIQNKFDYLLTMDADFSHDPIYINDLLKQSGGNNFVIGSRFCDGAKVITEVLEKLFLSEVINLQKKY